ncbi:MAG TPA: hypothetical protein VKE74_27930 [Gemmataceae bacterium]|nr:hypothetical protein [Gemmataceae bacterium]
MKAFLISSAVVVLVLAAPARGQETINNPEFASWSKFKPGTSVTMKTSTAAADFKTESTIKNTLVEVGTDKLVIETTVTMTVNGMEMKNPPMKREVPKQITIPAGAPKPPEPGKKPEGTVEEGTETLKIAGAEYKTKWYKTKNTIEGNTTEAKVWLSDDVPGTLVKLDSTTTGMVNVMLKMELAEFKKP